MPARIQLRRSRGWRKPEGAVNCARPGPLGNPFAHEDPAVAVQAFDHWLDARPFRADGLRIVGDATNLGAARMRGEIRMVQGLDCLCWCKLADPCHVDVILRRANGRG